MSAIHILNGPNLNLLGTRQPEIYGHATLADIEALCRKEAKTLNYTVEWLQSNEEGALVTAVQQARGAEGVIINAGAYSHTSIALLDALLALPCPIVEVHLSNIYQREEFRHHSYISRAAKGVICGFGAEGYAMAVRALHRLITA